MPPYAYFKKKFVPLEEAKIGILTHAFHYGTAVFEGIRGNWVEGDKQMYIFRLKEHYERLLVGCKILKIKLPYSADKFCELTLELIRKSGYREDVYIRPIAYKSEEKIGVRLHDIKDDFCIVVTTLAAYLDADAGVRCCISSWRRIDDCMVPSRGKISGTYINSALAKSEALERGFDEAILLSHEGYVSEGSGENIFVIIKGQILTPPSADSILLGYTRDTVMQIAKNELGIDVIERSIDRSDLIMADEVFLTGTAAHLTPVLMIDEYEVGNGQIGEITKKLQKLYFKTIQGKMPKYRHWLTPVFPKAGVSR